MKPPPPPEGSPTSRQRPLTIANFMDSSLCDLVSKGVFGSVGETYNPGRRFRRVLHYTPHARDIALADRLTDHRIEIHAHHVTGFSPGRILLSAWRLGRTFRAEGVDLVRGRLPYVGSLIGCLAARIAGLPSVVSLGGDNRIVQERNGIYNYGRRWLSYSIEWLVLKLATAIIVPNRFTERYVARICGQRTGRKCELIPWISEPVAEAEATPKKRDDLEEPRPMVLVVGFLNRYKYTDILFEALERHAGHFAVDGQPAQLVFCGDGPLREEGETRFAGRSDVRFLGWTERSHVHDLMRQARLVLIPMSGFVLLEAASIGKPVITSDVEWHGEMVRDGETGLVVNPTDPRAWADAARLLLANPLMASDMGKALKALYWRDYAPERAIALEAELYQKLVIKRP